MPPEDAFNPIWLSVTTTLLMVAVARFMANTPLVPLWVEALAASRRWGVASL